MTCEEARKKIGHLNLGELTTREEIVLRSHFVHCAACRVEEQLFIQIEEALSQETIVPPSHEFVARLIASLPLEMPQKTPSSFLKEVVWPAFAAAAMVTGIVFIGIFSLKKFPDSKAFLSNFAGLSTSIDSFFSGTFGNFSLLLLNPGKLLPLLSSPVFIGILVVALTMLGSMFYKNSSTA